MNFDKNKILNELIKLIEEEISKLNESFESNKSLSIEAPNRMQSRYDTMGIEAAWLADGIKKKIEEKKSDLSILKSIQLVPETKNMVSILSLVEVLSIEDNVVYTYFIVPVGGGKKIKYEDAIIQTISKNAPVAHILMNRSAGDVVEINNKEIKIVAIY